MRNVPKACRAFILTYRVDLNQLHIFMCRDWATSLPTPPQLSIRYLVCHSYSTFAA